MIPGDRSLKGTVPLRDLSPLCRSKHPWAGRRPTVGSMTGRARFWLAAVGVVLAVMVVVSRVQSVRASARNTSMLRAQSASLGHELREGQDRLAAALRDVDSRRFDEAERELTLARKLLGHAREQLLALGLSNESGRVLALLEGVEVARGLIVRLSVVQFETEQAALAGPQL